MVFLSYRFIELYERKVCDKIPIKRFFKRFIAFTSNAREDATLRALLFLLYVFSEDDNLSLDKDWSPPFAVIARSKTGNREG